MAMVRRHWLAHLNSSLAPGAVRNVLARLAFALSVAKRSRSADGKITTPNRRKDFVRVCMLLCAWTILLTGCVHATKTHFLQHYTLGAAASPPNAAGNEAPSVNGETLQIAQIVVPDWLDGTAMYYRLDYARDGRLAFYANSDWIAAPATLLEPLLENAIRSGNGWRAVTGPRSPASADVTLQIRLDDFSQAFPEPDKSAGVLDATATLISNRDQHVIAQRHFHIEAPAPTADAQGGAKALGDASAEFATRLRQWADSAAAGANVQRP